MRLLLAAMNCQKGAPMANVARHIELLRQAKASRCDLVTFPEMSLSGSVDPNTDSSRLLSLDHPAVKELVAATAHHGVAAVFGVAEVGPYISQVYARDGQIAGVYRKRHLGEGEEGYRTGTEPALWQFSQIAFGVAICAEGGVDFPFDEPTNAGARLVLFCAAPGLYGRRTDEAAMRSGFEWWTEWGFGNAKRHALRTGAWVALATQAGSTEDEEFPGGAALFGPSGEIEAQLPDWRPGTLIVDIPAS